MKNLIVYSLIFCLLSITTISCEKDNDSNNIDIVTNELIQGKWVVTQFNENGTDQTLTFNNFEFTFLQDGNVTAVKAGITPNATGIWNVYDANSQTILFLDFNNNFILSQLNNDWRIVEQNANLIRLEDISGGNGGTDLLTLVKI